MGIYLSKEPSYAANYAKPSAPLQGGLGRWSCLFLCEVAPGPLVTIGGEKCVIVRYAILYRRGAEETGGICSSTVQYTVAGIAILAAIFARTYFNSPYAYRRF